MQALEREAITTEADDYLGLGDSDERVMLRERFASSLGAGCRWSRKRGVPLWTRGSRARGPRRIPLECPLEPLPEVAGEHEEQYPYARAGRELQAGIEPCLEQVGASQKASLRPLCMTVTTTEGSIHEALAFNEVSLVRFSGQSANIRIDVNGRKRIDCLISDGVLVATPAGSTAYNLSAHGPVLPVEANLLALTPISPFRPRRWRGALLPETATVEFTVLDPEKRPVGACADSFEVRNASTVAVRSQADHAVPVLFDPGHSLEERVLGEQFAV